MYLGPHRKRQRKPGHDYSVGTYFVTVVTANRDALLGDLKNGIVQPSALGKQAVYCWNAIPRFCQHTEALDFVVMPDHVHGLIRLKPGSRTLGGVVKAFKAAVTSWSRQGGLETTVWQRGFNDQIVTSKAQLEKYRKYIATNPRQPPRRGR